MNLLSLGTFYVLAGILMLATALRVALHPGHPRRATTALFWGILGLVFAAGTRVPPLWVGYAVAGVALLAATGGVARSHGRTSSPEERLGSAERLGNRLFWPALLVPLTAVVGTLGFARIRWGGYRLVSPVNLSVTCVCIGAVLALALGLRLTRAPARVAVAEGSRLLQAIGWALILPQALAALGGLFAKAGTGAVVADLVQRSLPTQQAWVAVAAYALGMALFTVCMGNAFAAFAVITGGIGVPLIVQAHGGNPAIMAALGMLSGYCGTLVTPLAANFNLVPVLLLDLEDRHAVIKAQLPLALALLAFNVVLMEACVYRF